MRPRSLGPALWLVPLLLPLLGSGCARGAGAGSTTPNEEVRRLEELRITARPTDTGEFEFESYDAETLFQAAVREMRAERCERAVTLYDRVVEEFPSSRYRSPALYNAGLCLKEAEQWGDAAARFERLVRELPTSSDVKHATFQLAELYLEMEAWDRGVQTADRLLARDDLSSDERVEAMARRAQHLLGAERIEDAAQQARSALSWARTRRGNERVRDVYFTAAANYVLAETLRLQAAAMTPPEGSVAVQRPVLEARAAVILRAQRTYFDTMRHTHAEWAAAAGYRIGEMYEAFWDAIMSAPVPPPQGELPESDLPRYREEYREYLARLVKPLIRHSIRFWELTLLMIERTSVNTEWTTRIRSDLERARERLLAQPEGPEGFDAVAAGPDVEERPEDQENGSDVPGVESRDPEAQDDDSPAPTEGATDAAIREGAGAH